MPGEVYDLASSQPVSLIEILTWGDIAKAGRDLGYDPHTSLRDGLTAQLRDAGGRRELARSGVS